MGDDHRFMLKPYGQLPAESIRTDAPALVSPAGAPILTYRELQTEAHALAASIDFVQPGDVVASVLPSSVAFLVTLVATSSLGAVVAPISAASPPAGRQRLLERLQPRVLVGADPGLRCTTARATVVWIRTNSTRPERIDRVDPQADPAPGPGPVPTPGDALILFTSGSTGLPKGVVLTRDNVSAGISAVVATYGLCGEDRTIATLPLTHGHGLIGVLLSSMSVGASIVLGSRPAGDAAVDGAQHIQGVTWLSLVPPQLAALCARTGRERTRPSARWRFLRTASAPLHRSLATEAERLFACPVSEAYGMTETAHQAAANSPRFAERSLGSVGVATHLRFRCGPPAACGHELEVSGPAVFRGYLRDPQATCAAMRDGWYRTRDMGTMDAEGRITLLGRLSDSINRGGTKVSPVEVETVLAEHPDVLGSLVVGVAHPTLGEEVAALVCLRAGAMVTDEGILQYCAASLSPSKRPRLVRFVDAIPSLPNGKPSRQLARLLFRRPD